jgi:hypothetical protein
MPASRNRFAAKRVATPTASGCEEGCPWPDATRPDFDRFPDDRSGLVVRMECPAELGKKKQINVSE